MAVSAGSEPAEVANEEWEVAEESLIKDMVSAPVTSDAAPGPLPIAATEPTCFVLRPDAVALSAT